MEKYWQHNVFLIACECDLQFVSNNLEFVSRYDHLRKEASDVQPTSTDQASESWRSSLENSINNYLKDHYKYGVSSVYGSSSNGNVTLIVCIESHQYQPKNFWYVYILNSDYIAQLLYVVVSTRKYAYLCLFKDLLHFYCKALYVFV